MVSLFATSMMFLKFLISKHKEIRTKETCANWHANLLIWAAIYFRSIYAKVFLILKDSEQNITKGRNKFLVKDYFKCNVLMKRTNIYVTNRAKVKTKIIFINNKSKGKKLDS